MTTQGAERGFLGVPPDLIGTLPRPAPPMPRPFCCFCCCGPPRPRPLAASSRTISMISSGMRRYLMVLPRI